MTPSALVAKIRALDEAATPGEWTWTPTNVGAHDDAGWPLMARLQFGYGGREQYGFVDEDASLIAGFRSLAPEAADRLEEAEALLRRLVAMDQTVHGVEEGRRGYHDGQWVAECDECCEPWPCPTEVLRADAARWLGGERDG